MNGTILAVDDEPRILEVLDYALTQVGFEVTCVTNGEQAIVALEGGASFDLVILDVLMPGIDGLEVCRHMRSRGSTPIIFLSSRAEESDRVVGLELGGDDYICKPFSPRELCARVRSVIRRSHGGGGLERDLLRLGPLTVDIRRHVVEIAEVPISVTATEFALLAAILEADGEALSRRRLIDRAYGPEHHVCERTVDTHVKRLRRKLAAHEIDPIVTVTGIGYRAAETI